MYNNIVSPITGYAVSIHTKTGRNILNKYMEQLQNMEQYGGSRMKYRKRKYRQRKARKNKLKYKNLKNKKRNNRCCRCRQHILENPLGGKFGGVVCRFHRSCQKCWWGPSNNINETDKTIIPYNQGGEWNSNYGKRRREPKESKHIALVNKPRKNKHPECFGCLYKYPDHIDAPLRWIGASGTTNDPIEID